MASFLHHLGSYTLLMKATFSAPDHPRMFFKELLQQCVEIGYRSLGIVTVISLFIGAVSAVQTSYQLVSPLIPQVAIAQIVREAVLLEFSPTLVCIVLSGVIGSRITSEIGNMKVSEQIDALETMGVNAANWLILPKILAALLMIPCLIICSAALGILGGRMAADLSGILPAVLYDTGLLLGFKSFTVIFMMIKSVCFSFLIGSISCYFGFNVAENGRIGQTTTQAVITASVSILIADYLLSLLLLKN